MNPNGNASNLLPSEAGNERAVKHGVYSADRRVLEPVVRQVSERILSAPHVAELDELGATEIGRLEALIRACDADLMERGLTTKRGEARSLLDIRLRASRRLLDWCDRYGMTPLARSEWATKLASGGLGAEIQKRLRELDEQESGER